MAWASILPRGAATGLTRSYFRRWMSPRNPASYSPNERARSNSGAASRQSSQRPSPLSNVAPARRSPHTIHCGARVGWISARHSWQTGILEMRFSDVWQRRQSEGKRTEKMFSRSCKGARNRARGCARKSRRVRVSVSRLLKTALRSPREARPERSYVAGASGSG